MVRIYRNRLRGAGRPRAPTYGKGNLRGSAAGVVRKYAAKKKTGFQPGRRLAKSGIVTVRTPVGGATSQSNFSITHVQKKKGVAALLKYIGSPNFIVRQYAAQIPVQQGFQGSWSFGWNNVADLALMATKVPLNGTTPTGNFNAKRYELSSVNGDLLMTNSSLATAYVDIYDIVCKRDSNGSTDGNGGWMSNPKLAWAQGVADIDQVNVTASAYNLIKSLPYESQLFNDYFKVVRRHRVGLPSGATHRHTLKVAIDKMINVEMVEAFGANDPTANMRGLSMWTMVVASGQPSSIPQTGAPAIVTTAQLAIDCVQSLRYQFTWVQDTTRTGYYQDNLSSLTGEQVATSNSIVANQVV